MVTRRSVFANLLLPRELNQKLSCRDAEFWFGMDENTVAGVAARGQGCSEGGGHDDRWSLTLSTNMVKY